MFHLSEKEFREKMRKIRLKNEEIARKQELENEKNKFKKDKKKMQTTKIIASVLMVAMLLNCVAIEIYSAYAMLILQDLSALYALIGAVVSTTIGEVVAFTIYCFKSLNETKAEKELEFEYHKLEQRSSYSEDEAVG